MVFIRVNAPAFEPIVKHYRVAGSSKPAGGGKKNRVAKMKSVQYACLLATIILVNQRDIKRENSVLYSFLVKLFSC